MSGLSEEEHVLFDQLAGAIDCTILRKLDKQTPEEYTTGIMAGDAGSLLYLFHSAQYRDDEQLYDKAMYHLERLLDGVRPGEQESFCSGLPGTVWLLLYLQRSGMINTEEDFISQELIDWLCKESLQQLRAGQFDYMHGGLGMATALLCTREKTVQHTSYYEQVVAALASIAKPYGRDGIYWENHFSQKNHPGVPLGLSHGMASMISFLSKVSRYGICTDQCNELIRKAAFFLRAHSDHSNVESVYPAMVALGSKPPYTASLLAWCYGDMGVAASFIHAARATGIQEFSTEADLILSHLSRRDHVQQVMATDATFCHGTWGAAYLFNRYFQYNHDPELKQRADYWLRRSPDHTRCINLHVEMQVNERGVFSWSDDTGVLNGIAGAGLTILSALSPGQHSWDEVYFLDIN